MSVTPLAGILFFGSLPRNVNKRFTFVHSFIQIRTIWATRGIGIKTSMAAFGCRASRTFAENDQAALMKSNETNSRRAISGYRLVPLASRRAVSHVAARAIRCIHLRARLMNWHRPINPVPWGYYVPQPDSLPLLHTATLALSSYTSTRYVDTAP